VASAESFPSSPDSSNLLDSLVHMALDNPEDQNIFAFDFGNILLVIFQLMKKPQHYTSITHLVKKLVFFLFITITFIYFLLISLAYVDA
jgi:hypothetical protein